MFYNINIRRLNKVKDTYIEIYILYILLILLKKGYPVKIPYSSGHTGQS